MGRLDLVECTGQRRSKNRRGTRHIDITEGGGEQGRGGCLPSYKNRACRQGEASTTRNDGEKMKKPRARTRVGQRRGSQLPPTGHPGNFTTHIGRFCDRDNKNDKGDEKTGRTKDRGGVRGIFKVKLGHDSPSTIMKKD